MDCDDIQNDSPSSVSLFNYYFSNICEENHIPTNDYWGNQIGLTHYWLQSKGCIYGGISFTHSLGMPKASVSHRRRVLDFRETGLMSESGACQSTGS